MEPRGAVNGAGRPTSHAGSDSGIRFQTDDADALHARLKTSGVDVDADVMRLGSGVPPMFSFRDPDGNRLYVVEGSKTSR